MENEFDTTSVNIEERELIMLALSWKLTESPNMTIGELCSQFELEPSLLAPPLC